MQRIKYSFSKHHHPLFPKKPVRVAITGASGQIAYSLAFRIANGQMLGRDQPVILHLIDQTSALNSLHGVVLEIQDCAFPLVYGIVATDKTAIGLKDVDYALLVGLKPRGPLNERGDLLNENGKLWTEKGKYLNEHASKDVKVLVVGDHCNTNCLLLAHAAKDIPNLNFTGLARLDHNRTLNQLAKHLDVSHQDVKGVAVFGNHSPTVMPYLDAITVKGDRVTVAHKWVSEQCIPTVQHRGSEIIKARKLPSSGSAATAILNHMSTWVEGTKQDWTSMIVESDGSYGVPKGLFCSFPVTIQDGVHRIVKDLEISDFYKPLLDNTITELIEERHAIDHFIR